MSTIDINIDKKREIKRSDGILSAYQGYFCDNEKLLQSSSGGLATAISEKIINLGGVVYGVAYSDDFKSAHYKCVESIDELKAFKGSKYIKAHLQCDGVSVFKSVKEKLDQGRVVLFIGVPCAVVAMSCFLKKKYDNLFLVDLICYGTTLDIVQDQFITKLEKQYSSKIIDYTLRYKKEGWEPPYIRAVFENNDIYEKKLYESDFGITFLNYSHISCSKCSAKSINHKSDITLGDFWGLSMESDTYNKNGVSIAFTRSKQGEFLISNIDGFVLNPADIDMALRDNPLVNNQRVFDMSIQSDFDRLIKNEGLHKACLNYLSKKDRNES